MTLKTKKIHNVAVVGATGTVGEVMLEILAERNFPIASLYPVASQRSVGNTVLFKEQALPVEALESFDFSKVDLALFSAGSLCSKTYVPKAVAQGCTVIDNTAQFRYEPHIPLIVPEVNPHALSNYKTPGIIANPNCSTIQMVVALKPIYDAAGIVRVNAVTFQSVSGAGKQAIQELAEQSANLLNGHPIDEPKAFPKQIAFNVLPHIDIFLENGYTKEEMKMFWETQKILQDNTIQVNATAVRVPVFYGHSIAIHLETRHKLTPQEAQQLFRTAPGIQLMDACQDGGYPTAATDAAETDAVYVGRIRADLTHPNGLNLWVVSDNIRKGAALNSIQIAEMLIA